MISRFLLTLHIGKSYNSVHITGTLHTQRVYKQEVLDKQNKMSHGDLTY